MGYPRCDAGAIIGSGAPPRGRTSGILHDLGPVGFFSGKAKFRSWSASQIVPDRGRHVAGSARSWQARGRSGYHSTARLRVARETVARLADPGVASARWPSVEDRGRHVPGSARSCQAVQHLSYTTDARAQVARWATSMTAQHMNVLHSRAASASAGGRVTKPRRAEP